MKHKEKGSFSCKFADLKPVAAFEKISARVFLLDLPKFIEDTATLQALLIINFSYIAVQDLWFC